MAISKGNPITKGARGMVGKTFYFRETFGQLQLVNRPRKKTSYTENELLNQLRWQEAATYAKKQMEDPEVEKEYAKGINPGRRSAYHVAMCDYLHAPTVHYINAKLYTGAIGETITIKASDDFKVERVAVDIVSTKGKVIERGDASRYLYKPFIWKYKTCMKNPKIKGTVIRVVAFDRPGNKGVAELEL